MNEQENGAPSAEAQLRLAWDGVSRVLDDLLRRNEEFVAELAEARERERTLTDRLATMERTLDSYQATLEKVSTSLFEATDRARQVEQNARTQLARARAEAEQRAGVADEEFESLQARQRDALATLEAGLADQVVEAPPPEVHPEPAPAPAADPVPAIPEPLTVAAVGEAQTVAELIARMSQ
jgi:chromosome segregation ATPase